MHWNPLFDQNQSEPYKNKLHQLGKALHSWNNITNPGLLNGRAGISLFFFYLGKFFEDEKYIEKGYSLIHTVFDDINKGYANQSFSSGLAGIAWAVRFLVNNDFLDKQALEGFDQLDKFLEKSMMNEISIGNFDYLHGALGIACYLMNKNDYNREMIADMIDILSGLSISFRGEGSAWPSKTNGNKRKLVFNLGLAHGQPSIIYFLSKAFQTGIRKDNINRMLRKNVQFLQSHRNSPDGPGSCFSNWIMPGEKPGNSRLAWCYGDLGVAVSLWNAGNVLDEQSWKDEAENIFLKTLKRKLWAPNGVADASFCHGTAGIAHIYNRMYQSTGKKHYKLAAGFWLKETLKMATHNNGIAGYRYWYLSSEDNYKDEPGLLEGAAGIGLVIMAAISNLVPAWDEALMLG
ncbi:MAG: lanthionine synthetase C family protein [Bacteroidales bacterium]|nr:lanthionine synthetase C family protein [Bacteroidales bacterium]